MPEGRPITPALFTAEPNGPRLIVGRCGACTALHFPAAPTCPYCAFESCTETPVGPGGRLWLYTSVLTRPPGYRGPVPYGFGVVELAGGLRVVTRLTESRVECLHRGMAMQLVIEPLFTDDAGCSVLSYAFAPER